MATAEQHRGAHAPTIVNLGTWLTTVVARICLDRCDCRSRSPGLASHITDPVVDPVGEFDTEHRANS